MTPRFPADPKFRRHPNRAMQGVFRVGMVAAAVMAVGLSWSMLKEKSDGKKQEVAAASPAPIAPAPPPVVAQPVAKVAPVGKPKSVLAMVDLPPPREPVKAVAPPPPPPPAVVESKPVVVAEVKETKTAKAAPKPAPEAKEEEIKIEEGMDLTFYREFQDRRMVLPALAGKTPLVVAPDSGKPLMKTPTTPLAKPVLAAAQPLPTPVPVAQTNRVVSPGNYPWGWNERSGDSRPEGAVASSRSRYVVQVMVLPEFDQAAALAGRLQRQGVNAQITRTQNNGAPAYRVQVGPFPSREEASSKAQQWKTGGVVVPES